MAITILIAEDDALLRSFLSEVLDREPDFSIAASVADGNSCLEAIQQHQPQIVLLDLNLPGLSGMKVLERLGQQETEGPCVLVLSGTEDEETQVEAARNGARGFLAKSQAVSLLAQAIRAVADGELWFSRRVSSYIFLEHQRLVRRVREQDRPLNQLSDREREVLACVARGMTNGQIAGDLYMSIHTVKLHIQNILRKLNLPNRTEAAVFAVREGLLDEEPSGNGARK